MAATSSTDMQIARPAATEKKRYLTVVPSLFSVVSWGCAGTAWLARALNSHPDVFCVQAANNYLHAMRGVAPMDGLEYMHVLAAIATGHAAVGDVHGISRLLIPELKENYGDVFSAAVLVREPLPRIRSQMALYKAMPHTANWDLSYIDPMVRQLGYSADTLTQDDRLKFHAFNMLNNITEERQAGPIYRIEDLVHQRESMAALLHHLTRGRLQSPGWWLDYVLQLPALNGHSRDGLAEELSPADGQLLSRVVTEEAKSHYRDLGYRVKW